VLHVLGVFGEVLIEQVQRIAFWASVALAAVPKIAPAANAAFIALYDCSADDGFARHVMPIWLLARSTYYYEFDVCHTHEAKANGTDFLSS
jgi:hypothetical protein